MSDGRDGHEEHDPAPPPAWPPPPAPPAWETPPAPPGPPPPDPTWVQDAPSGPPSYEPPPPDPSPPYGAPAGGPGPSPYGPPPAGPPFGSPSPGGPGYGAPTYGAPSYGGPTYGAPSYGGPSYGGLPPSVPLGYATYGGYAPGYARLPSLKGYAVASMVLGICALVFSVCCWPLGIVLALVGLPLGAIAMSKMGNGTADPDGRGMALAGVIMGGVSLVIAFGVLALSFVS